ncbi:hypothetical protein [Brevibacillus nitrificans]|uniref:hypothetical protein n=1 Tax=Brevibacillus nitrificans TaxID=651560 RepID=UPI002862FD24|nr:hypothetical protein [Brevibacillus nitrificans]MDR7315497.1 hypothetical protein [Brevibacillus nitrificans]
MYKKAVTFACLLIFLAIYIFAARPPFLYHALPFHALPFHAVSKATVVSLLHENPYDRVKLLAVEGEYAWYGTKASQGLAAERLKSAIEAKGWLFLQQEGSGYFFEKDREKIVITSQMWSREFVFFKVPIWITYETPVRSI